MEQGGFDSTFGAAVAALALLLIYGGASKLFYVREFRAALTLVPYLPVELVPAVARVIPLLEVLGGVGLLLARPWGAWITLGILASASAVAVIAKMRNQRVPCVCFTASASEDLSLVTVARNAVFAAIAAMPLVMAVRSPFEQPFLLSCAIVLIFLYLSIDGVLKNARDMIRTWSST